MSFLSAKIDEKIENLKREFETNKKVLHQGVKGGFNEGGMSSLIKDIIPTKYKITRGIVENSEGGQSNETDIIIYDDEVLPPYIKNDLSFVPVEAVKYVFEVKSKLDSSELKTTISKFRNFKLIGGRAPGVLFSYSSDIAGDELECYYKNENDFFINPSINVLCVSGKCYYYKSVTEHYLKDSFTNEQWLELYKEASGLSIDGPIEAISALMSNEAALQQLKRSEFALLIKGSIQMDNHRDSMNEKELTINGVKFNDIKYKIHTWVGVKQKVGALNNSVELSFLSGVSNTLSKGNFGNYLLSDVDLEFKTYARCYEDMWGNLSCQEFKVDGMDVGIGKVTFSYSICGESNSHKMIFETGV